MNKKYKLTILVVFVLGVAGLLGVLFFGGSNMVVLNPKGTIADKQRALMIVATLLMLLIVIPVFALTFGIAWKYRAGNTSAKYTPEWDGSHIAETIWWLVPLAIISVLAVIAWRSSHELDPYKRLDTAAKPITIQVVALNWKWLFIYPEQDIATVNVVQFPEKTPVNFEITADAPMNSFWIPQLGGQVYAMAGMKTQLHLMADGVGSYAGSSANLSGQGFAGMKFRATSSSQADFDQWVRSAKHSPNRLSKSAYKSLAKPSQNNPPAYYSARDEHLYDTVIMKYMMPVPKVQE